MSKLLAEGELIPLLTCDLYDFAVIIKFWIPSLKFSRAYPQSWTCVEYMAPMRSVVIGPEFDYDVYIIHVIGEREST